MSSAAVPVENIPGIVKAIPGSGENHSPSRRNHCSPSARNPVRLHPGIVFTFTPESFSPSPGIRKQVQLIKVASLRELPVTDRQCEEFRQACIEAAGCYKSPEQAEAELATLEEKLLLEASP